jgi:hypothetical protein
VEPPRARADASPRRSRPERAGSEASDSAPRANLRHQRRPIALSTETPRDDKLVSVVTVVTVCAIVVLLVAPVGGKAYWRWRARRARFPEAVVAHLDDRRAKSD